VSNKPYVPPKVWINDAPSGGQFASINRPTAGPTHDKALPIGKHPLQLYSLATPNGVKVTILLEELLALGKTGAEYDAWLIRIGEGDQFSSGFVEINPNSKIPALLDRSVEPPIRVFESGSILLYLAEKFGAFLPTDPAGRTETLNWLFWQMGAAPYLVAGSGIFTPMRRRSSSTRSTVSPWKPSVSWTSSTAVLPKARTWPVTAIPSPISRSGPGTASWCGTRCTRLPSFCLRMSTPMCNAGPRRLPTGRRSFGVSVSTGRGG
jgi:hypothetical protein